MRRDFLAIVKNILTDEYPFQCEVGRISLFSYKNKSTRSQSNVWYDSDMTALKKYIEYIIYSRDPHSTHHLMKMKYTRLYVDRTVVITCQTKELNTVGFRHAFVKVIYVA